MNIEKLLSFLSSWITAIFDARSFFQPFDDLNLRVAQPISYPFTADHFYPIFCVDNEIALHQIFRNKNFVDFAEIEIYFFICPKLDESRSFVTFFFWNLRIHSSHFQTGTKVQQRLERIFIIIIFLNLESKRKLF